MREEHEYPHQEIVYTLEIVDLQHVDDNEWGNA